MTVRKGVERSERRVGVVLIDGVQRIVRIDLVDGIEGVPGIHRIDRVQGIVRAQLIDRIEDVVVPLVLFVEAKLVTLVPLRGSS